MSNGGAGSKNLEDERKLGEGSGRGKDRDGISESFSFLSRLTTHSTPLSPKASESPQTNKGWNQELVGAAAAGATLGKNCTVYTGTLVLRPMCKRFGGLGKALNPPLGLIPTGMMVAGPFMAVVGV